MKNDIKISIVLLALCTLLKAQDTTKKCELGLDISYVRPDLFKEGFFPSLTFSFNKQVVFGGMSIVTYDAWHPKPLTGIHAGYQVFPNGRDKKFNLFFEANSCFLKGAISENVPVYYFETWGGTAKRTMNLTAIDTYFGFGFRWNLLKNLYLATNLGVDLGFYKEDYTYTYTSGQTYKGEGNLALRDPFALTKIFKLSIGYNVFNFKK